MYAKEKASSKQKRLLDISFVQNDKEKSILFVYHPDKKKRPFLFAVLAVLTGSDEDTFERIIPRFSRIKKATSKRDGLLDQVRLCVVSMTVTGLR